MNQPDRFSPPPEVVTARREALLKIARAEQMREKAGSGSSRFQNRLLSYAGDLLIRLGNRFKNREPIPPSPFNITPHL